MKNNKTKLKIKFFSFLMFFTIVIVIPVNADTKTWNGSVITNWGTATEIQNYGFEVVMVSNSQPISY